LTGIATLIAALACTPAYAIPRTFVSGTGAGAACTRAAPCATFQAAHDATDSGGEVNCLDAGEFGRVTVTKSITIDCTGVLGSILAAGNGAVDSDTPGIVIRLRNLGIRGIGASAGGDLRGVNISGAAALFIENCTIAELGGFGISFFPNNAAAKLLVSDTVITNTRGGIRVQIFGSGFARVMIDRTRIESSDDVGISATSFPGADAGVLAMQVRNSAIAGSVIGLDASTGTPAAGTISVTADRSAVTLSGSAGVISSGANSFVTLGRSTLTSNAPGLIAGASGAILSYQNNQLAGNIESDGAPTGTLNPQ
jgi:hypothetical protein